MFDLKCFEHKSAIALLLNCFDQLFMISPLPLCHHIQEVYGRYTQSRKGRNGDIQLVRRHVLTEKEGNMIVNAEWKLLGE